MSLALPSFSIVIPTYARPDRLALCLQALAQLDYPREHFEIILVDDGSPSPPTDLINAWKQQLPLKFLVQAHGGPALARNLGAAEAHSAYLAFTDDDCAPESNWLTVFAQQLSNFPECALGGQIINALPNNPYSSVSQDLVTYLYSRFNHDPEQARFFTSNNLVVPVEAFRALGGFDSNFKFAAGEDRDFCDRWLGSGHGLRYVAQAVVRHSHQLTLTSFWRQHFNYGRGGYHFHKYKAKRRATASRFESWRFYLDLLMQPLKSAPNRQQPRLRLGLLTVLSQVANLAGYFHESWTDSVSR